jgi:hypothetical protein
MRSEKNPYFILKASKKSHIQQWLSQAETLSVQEIDRLPIKPDLKKAMLYAHELVRSQQVDQLAENYADMMTMDFIPQQQEFSIYHYVGGTRWMIVSNHSSVEIGSGIFWGLIQDQMFVNHCWSNLKDNPWLLEDSQLHCMGNSSIINMLNASKHALIGGS